jgi:WD40 repeat protein
VFVFLIWTLTLDMPSIEAKAESAKNDLKSHEIKALENALDASFELKSLTGKFSWIPVLNSNPPLLYSPLESLQTNMAKIHEQDEIDISSKFSSVQAMSVSRDGTALAISQGDNEKKIQVWKQPTSTQLNEELGKTIIEKPSYELKNCDDNIFSLGVDSTGKRLVTGGSEGTVCLFLDIEAKKSESTVILTKTNQRINSVNFSQDDKLIAIAKADGQVVVVNLKGRVLNSF